MHYNLKIQIHKIMEKKLKQKIMKKKDFQEYTIQKI